MLSILHIPPIAMENRTNDENPMDGIGSHDFQTNPCSHPGVDRIWNMECERILTKMGICLNMSHSICFRMTI